MGENRSKMLIFHTLVKLNLSFFHFFFSQIPFFLTFAHKCGHPMGCEKGNGCESRAVPLLYTFINLLKSVCRSVVAKVRFVLKVFRHLHTKRRRNATMLDGKPTREGF